MLISPPSITMPSLTQHQKSNKHCSCPLCDPFDTHEALLEARLSPVDKYSCPECKRRFALKPSLEAHQCESLHAYCSKCNILSSTKHLHALHMQLHAPVRAMTPSSATQFRCCDCERDFISEKALTDHLRCSKIHGMGKRGNKKKVKGKDQQEEGSKGSQRTKCQKCKRIFTSGDALRRHLTSVRHNPLSDIKCVANAECKKQFNCPSAQLHHLEAGRCVSGMTKTKLNAAIAANDPGRIITSKGATALLEDNSSATSTSQIRSPILTPTTTEFLDSYPPSSILTPTSPLSTSTNFYSLLTLRPRTWSGIQKCLLCPPSCTRTFKNNSALQQHLSSRVHAPVLMSLPLPVPDEISFHCPRTLMDETSKKKAIRQFSTVSGLAQHLESGACDGGNGTFRRVVEYVQKEMKGMGFDGVKLLK